jgi:hypothetical protein
MSTAHVEAVAAVLVATGFVWVAFLDRRRGSRLWWAYLLGSAFVYADAVRAATGTTLTGW